MVRQRRFVEDSVYRYYKSVPTYLETDVFVCSKTVHACMHGRCVFHPCLFIRGEMSSASPTSSWCCHRSTQLQISSRAMDLIIGMNTCSYRNKSASLNELSMSMSRTEKSTCRFQ
jgi:hypothetical protein